MVKPNNIWIRPNKETLLLDFGTARIINDPIKSKQPPMHTPGYAAPEQHKDFLQPHRIGPWTDYYGLGATLYALIEKNSPEVSTELFLNNKSTDLLTTRQGQYNTILLNIVNTLMALDWEKRQRIVLREIIEQLHRIKPIKQISLAIESLNELMHDANNHFHKELKNEN